MSDISTKPYLVRAIYEWCTDSGFTPYLVVIVGEHTRVPTEYAKDGQVVLNIGPSATRGLSIGNDMIQFSARFGGASRDIEVPMDAVASIYARENAQGLSFAVVEQGEEGFAGGASVDGAPGDLPPSPRGKPRLKIVK